MYEWDYIPLDQAVIDQEVKRLAQQRRSAKIYLTKAIKGKNAGGNFDIIVFHEIRKNFTEFKSIVKALETLRLDWYEIDGDLYVNRHEIEDVIYDRPRD